MQEAPALPASPTADVADWLGSWRSVLAEVDAVNDKVQADGPDAVVALASELDGLPPAELKASCTCLADLIPLELHWTREGSREGGRSTMRDEGGRAVPSHRGHGRLASSARGGGPLACGPGAAASASGVPATYARLTRAATSLGRGPQLSMREGPRTREDDPPYEIDFYEDGAGRKPALEWLQGLERRQRRIVGTALRELLAHQGINICSTSFGRQLGEGLFEFRLREEELLVRVFCHAHGQRLILLLGGYDKGKDPARKRQEAEIAEARRRLKAWTARRRGGLTI